MGVPVAYASIIRPPPRYMVTWPGGVERATPMKPVDADRAYQYWRATTTMPAGETLYGYVPQAGLPKGFAPASGRRAA